MGLKSKLNKMKSFLFDEEDEENTSIKSKMKDKIKKKDNVSEIKEKKEKREENNIKTDFDDLYFEDISEINTDTTVIHSRTVKNETEFKFPEFNDEDFMVSKKMPEPVRIEPRKEEKVVLYQGSKRKEETKKFKPSPIISPIYGLLDNDGNIVEKDNTIGPKIPSNVKEEMTLDAIRKKAYGNLDEKLEDTLKRLSSKTIEEAEKDMEDEEKNLDSLSRTKQKQKIKEKEVDPIVVKNNDKDDMILPNVNFKEIDVDLERSKVNEKNHTVSNSNAYDDDDDDTKEQDLFHLIDTMYSEKEDKN